MKEVLELFLNLFLKFIQVYFSLLMRPGHFSTTLSLDAWPLTMFACRLHAQLSKDTVEDIIHYADQSHFCRDEYVFKNSLSDLA